MLFAFGQAKVFSEAFRLSGRKELKKIVGIDYTLLGLSVTTSSPDFSHERGGHREETGPYMGACLATNYGSVSTEHHNDSMKRIFMCMRVHGQRFHDHLIHLRLMNNDE
jgi:hypothetical protein